MKWYGALFLVLFWGGLCGCTPTTTSAPKLRVEAHLSYPYMSFRLQQAQQYKQIVYVEVYDENRLPVGGAQVSLQYSANAGPVIMFPLTDAQGKTQAEIPLAPTAPTQVSRQYLALKAKLNNREGYFNVSFELGP